MGKNAQNAQAQAGSNLKIRVDPNNFRLHPDNNKALIKRSLEENGAGRSIVVDNTGTAIGGSGVLEQAEKLGLHKRIVETTGNELVVVVRKDISPDDPRRKMLALADNATTDQGEWDVAQLEANFGCDNLKEWGVELPNMDDAETDLPDLGDDGDKMPFEQMTFTLSAEQADNVRKAIEKAKKTDEYKKLAAQEADLGERGNTNSNGNALSLIILEYL